MTFEQAFWIIGVFGGLMTLWGVIAAIVAVVGWGGLLWGCVLCVLLGMAGVAYRRWTDGRAESTQTPCVTGPGVGDATGGVALSDEDDHLRLVLAQDVL
jgi:hypothetical protein